MKNISHSVNDLYWFVLPLILPGLLTRFDLSYGKAGSILTIFLTVAGVGSFLSGKISDHVGRKQILGYGFIVSALGFTASAFAPSFTVFVSIIAVTALGVSTFHPVMYAVIDETFAEDKGKVLGVYEAFGTGAILLMYFVNGFLLSKIGIRGVLIVTALPAIVMGIYYLNTDNISEAVKRKEENSQEVSGAVPGYKKVFILFVVSVIARVFTVMAVMNFFPLIFTGYHGFSQSSSVYISALFFAGGILGSLYVGRLSDKRDSVVILMVLTAAIIASVMVFRYHLHPYYYFAAVFIFGISGSGALINQNLLIAKLGSHFGRGEVFGILMGVMTVTGAVSPAVFGITIDDFGFSRAITAFVIPAVLSLVLLVPVKIGIRKAER